MGFKLRLVSVSCSQKRSAVGLVAVTAPLSRSKSQVPGRVVSPFEKTAESGRSEGAISMYRAATHPDLPAALTLSHVEPTSCPPSTVTWAPLFSVVIMLASVLGASRRLSGSLG